MGASQADAASFVGVKPMTPYVKVYRDAKFKAQVEAAMEEGRLSLITSPDFFCLPNGAPLLDSDFEPIPRQPPNGLKPWVRAQLLKSPLLQIAS